MLQVSRKQLDIYGSDTIEIDADAYAAITSIRGNVFAIKGSTFSLSHAPFFLPPSGPIAVQINLDTPLKQPGVIVKWKAHDFLLTDPRVPVKDFHKFRLLLSPNAGEYQHSGNIRPWMHRQHFVLLPPPRLPHGPCKFVGGIDPLSGCNAMFC